jgi:hypothetical protein
VVDERIADGLATTKHDVDHAFGQNVGQHFRHFQRGQRCLFGRLEDDCIAAADGRRELPCHHHQRVVPRRDRGNDSNRIAPDHRGEASEIFARHSTRHGAHRAGEEAVAVDNGWNLVIEDGVDRFAAIERLQCGEFFRFLFDAIGDLEKVAGPLPRSSATRSRKLFRRRQSRLRSGSAKLRASPARSSPVSG